MLVPAGHSLVVPWEVAVAFWMLFARVTGPPALPPTSADAAVAAGAAQEFRTSAWCSTTPGPPRSPR